MDKEDIFCRCRTLKYSYSLLANMFKNYVKRGMMYFET